MRLLIDGDILAYKACMLKEVAVDWGDDLWTLHCYENEVRAYILDELLALKQDTGADRYTIFLSSDHNFRKIVDPTYKSNRANVRKPICLRSVKQWMIVELDAVVYANVEADDAIGIEATKYDDTAIVSIDKDLRTIPCQLWNEKEKVFQTITEEAADYNFITQALTGDTTDGYGGCPKVGPKTAEKILHPPKGTERTLEWMWDQTIAAYFKAGLGPEYALSQARLARILRDGEYDEKTSQPILWTPPEIRTSQND